MGGWDKKLGLGLGLGLAHNGSGGPGGVPGCSDPHCSPPPKYPWPVIVPIRHPLERLESMLTYEGFKIGNTADVIIGNSTPGWIWRMVLGPTSYLRRFNLGPRELRIQQPDIYLCVAQRRFTSSRPDLTQQLRRAFHDPLIRTVPLENVNHRNRVIRLPPGRNLSSYVHPLDWWVWRAKCGLTR